MSISLLLGFVMTLVGYVGCFTIVQGSSPLDTYIWLGIEAVLALIRLLTWAWNLSWDESDGVCLILKCSRTPPVDATLETAENPVQTFKIVTDDKFWETQTAYAGPVNAEEMKRIPGFRHWYSQTRNIPSIVLREERMGGMGGMVGMGEMSRMGGQTVLCTMNSDKDLNFYHAEINVDASYAVTATRKAPLEEDHTLMKWPSEFKIDVFFEHYSYISGTKPSGFDRVKASWPLSHPS
jgi:hypothetical protein